MGMSNGWPNSIGVKQIAIELFYEIVNFFNKLFSSAQWSRRMYLLLYCRGNEASKCVH